MDQFSKRVCVGGGGGDKIELKKKNQSQDAQVISPSLPGARNRSRLLRSDR